MKHQKVKEVIWRKRAFKQFMKLPRVSRDTIIEKIDLLAAAALNLDIKKLKEKNLHRLRVGEYRVIYQSDGKKLSIEILVIGHRKNIYDKV